MVRSGLSAILHSAPLGSPWLSLPDGAQYNQHNSSECHPQRASHIIGNAPNGSEMSFILENDLSSIQSIESRDLTSDLIPHLQSDVYMMSLFPCKSVLQGKPCR